VKYAVIYESADGVRARVPEVMPAHRAWYREFARRGDLLFVISLSGRQVMPVELAAHARERGLTVIGLTSLAYPQAVSSRHPSGHYLKDECDIVLDNKIAVGDGELTAEGADTTFGPVSSITTIALMQAVVADAMAGGAAGFASSASPTQPRRSSGCSSRPACASAPRSPGWPAARRRCSCAR